MVKPVYLYDLVTQDFIEIPSDKTPRSVGRAKECDLVIDPTFRNISRLQVVVQYFPHGDILLTQKSSNCDSSSWRLSRTTGHLSLYKVPFNITGNIISGLSLIGGGRESAVLARDFC